MKAIVFLEEIFRGENLLAGRTFPNLFLTLPVAVVVVVVAAVVVVVVVLFHVSVEVNVSEKRLFAQSAGERGRRFIMGRRIFRSNFLLQ